MRHDDNEKNKWISSMPSLSFHYQGLLQHNTLEVILSIIFIVACWMMISFHVVVDDTKEWKICWWSIFLCVLSIKKSFNSQEIATIRCQIKYVWCLIDIRKNLLKLFAEFPIKINKKIFFWAEKLLSLLISY